MRFFKYLLIPAAIFVPLVAQEAKILIVEKPDAQKLQRAYREYKEAAKRWEDAKAEVAKQYTLDGGKVMKGWDKVSFSADFRAIVPKVPTYNDCWYGGTILTNTGNVMPVSGTGSFVLSDMDVDSSLATKEKKQ